MPMYIVISLLLVLIFLEGLIWLLIRYLRKDFQWLITKEDELPRFDPDALASFIRNKYSPSLGWTIKPDTHSKESTGALGALAGHEKVVNFNSNQYGGRVNPGNEDLPKLISSYGDSYAFCRQVEDNESWQWHLSNRFQINTMNFGVGNFGMDQALIRLKEEYDRNPADIVILEAVPETIVRVTSVWKHYYEYGNIYAFKPFFQLKDGKLIQHENIINSPDKFGHIEQYLDTIKQYDVFYRTKFQKYLFKFPFSLSMIRHPIRNFSLLAGLLIRKVGKVFGKKYDQPWKIILRDNARYCKEMYRQKYPVQLMFAIVEEFARYAAEKGFKPVLLILPFEEDLAYYRKHGTKYYDHFIRGAEKIVQTIDLTEPLAQHEENLYTNAFYGSHLNPAGNLLVAKYLGDALVSLIKSSGKEITDQS